MTNDSQNQPLRQTLVPGNYSWCSCGLSQKAPLCDGSHKGTNHKPIRVTIEKEGTVAWRTCKKSEKLPFCDGAHKNL